MKKIINGKLYNTETATYICKYPVEDIHIGNDINTVYSIYKKKTGEFFANIIRFDDFCDSYEYIEPLTNDSAARLCEGLMCADDYITIFGEVAE